MSLRGVSQVSMCLVPIFTMLFLWNWRSPPSLQDRVIAKEFSLVDDGGIVRGGVSVSEEGETVVVFHSSDHTSKFSLRLAEDEAELTFGRPGLGMLRIYADDHGLIRLMQHSGESTGVSVSQVSPLGPSIALYESEEVESLRLGSNFVDGESVPVSTIVFRGESGDVIKQIGGND